MCLRLFQRDIAFNGSIVSVSSESNNPVDSLFAHGLLSSEMVETIKRLKWALLVPEVIKYLTNSPGNCCTSQLTIEMAITVNVSVYIVFLVTPYNCMNVSSAVINRLTCGDRFFAIIKPT
jgi:hypothetical protein